MIDLAGKLDDARARVEAEVPAHERGLAKFARLTRKDARVRADQDAALSALVKTVMRQRSVKAERITENTLIRVAIDLLLTHADALRGSTEDELRESVTPRLPKLRSPGLPTSPTSALPQSRTAQAPDSHTPAVRDSARSEPRALRTMDAANSRASAVPGPAASDLRDIRATTHPDSDAVVPAAPTGAARARGW